MPTLDEQIAAVERAAKGMKVADLRRHTLTLMAAAASLRSFQTSRLNATQALDRIDASAARVAASLDRSRRP